MAPSIQVVTSCSHIFCDDDGSREFNRSYTCPACNTSLSSKFDILRIDLQPTEQSKSMLLAGHKPETILEVASRAMAFWTYQTHQELMYQEYAATRAKERNTQLEQFYEQVLSRAQVELNSLKNQLSTLRKEQEETKKRYNEVSEKMKERSRQYQKLQGLYDGLRRRTINPTMMDGNSDRPHFSTPRTRVQAASMFNMGISESVDEVFRRLPGQERDKTFKHPHRNSAERPEDSDDFVFCPTSTPTLSGACDASTTHQHRFALPIESPSRQRRANSVDRIADRRPRH